MLTLLAWLFLTLRERCILAMYNDEYTPSLICRVCSLTLAPMPLGKVSVGHNHIATGPLRRPQKTSSLPIMRSGPQGVKCPVYGGVLFQGLFKEVVYLCPIVKMPSI